MSRQAVAGTRADIFWEGLVGAEVYLAPLSDAEKNPSDDASLNAIIILTMVIERTKKIYQLLTLLLTKRRRNGTIGRKKTIGPSPR